MVRNVWRDGSTDGRTDKRTDRRTDGRTNGRTEVTYTNLVPHRIAKFLFQLTIFHIPFEITICLF